MSESMHVLLISLQWNSLISFSDTPSIEYILIQ